MRMPTERGKILHLLRRFEPIMRFTQGETFFPMDVGRYVRDCSLWVQPPDRAPKIVVPDGELALATLSDPQCAEFDAIPYLKYIDPLEIPELAAYQLERVRQELVGGGDRERFQAGRGRLARVGYVSRVIDAVFSLTLLARGRVSGDTAAAASIAYHRLMDSDEHYVYNGRVARDGGWIVLQYWFFYAFNNWRSGFFGANDHEADWEMVSIYLWDDGGTLRPEWIAYACHDFSGGDLRRRWDDPEVETVGEHPVVYVGAGSHASYFSAGEYLSELEIGFLSPVNRLARGAQRVFQRLVGEAVEDAEALNVLRVPFVDYARGDGRAVGPGMDREWDSPRLLSPLPAWARDYRGLWGLYAGDPVRGENAPAGPVYERDGAVRRSWYDPVGWADLHTVPTPMERTTYLAQRSQELRATIEQSDAAIRDLSERLLAMGAEIEALKGHPHLKGVFDARRERIAQLAAELDQRRRRAAEDGAALDALECHRQAWPEEEGGASRDHIQRPQRPATGAELRLGRLAEGWAAVSIGLMMVGVVALVIFAQDYLAEGLTVMLAFLVVVEASFRRRLTRILGSAAVALAVLAGLILLYEFFWQTVVAVLLLAGAYIIIENVRELVA